MENINAEKVLKLSSELNSKFIDNLATKALKHNKFKTQMQTEFNFLYKNYEPIFNISLTNSYDYNRLAKMLNLANKVKNNVLSEHQASVQVGQILVDDIVKPQMDKAGIKPKKK